MNSKKKFKILAAFFYMERYLVAMHNFIKKEKAPEKQKHTIKSAEALASRNVSALCAIDKNAGVYTGTLKEKIFLPSYWNLCG